MGVKILFRRGRQLGRKQGDMAAVGAPQLNIAQGPAASKTPLTPTRDMT